MIGTFREHYFSYYLGTEGLPEELTCIVEYELTDESFDAFGLGGELGTFKRTGAEILDLRVFASGQLVDPEDLDLGLTDSIKEEALNQITQDL